MILYLDTTDNLKTNITVIKDSSFIAGSFNQINSAEKFPEQVKDFLFKNKIRFKDITKVAVKVGSGYFSRQRMSVVLANALAFSLNIPVVKVEKDFNIEQVRKSSGQSAIVPVYGANPNISKPKRK